MEHMNENISIITSFMSKKLIIWSYVFKTLFVIVCVLKNILLNKIIIRKWKLFHLSSNSFVPIVVLTFRKNFHSSSWINWYCIWNCLFKIKEFNFNPFHPIGHFGLRCPFFFCPKKLECFTMKYNIHIEHHWLSCQV